MTKPSEKQDYCIIINTFYLFLPHSLRNPDIERTSLRLEMDLCLFIHNGLLTRKAEAGIQLICHKLLYRINRCFI